MSTAVATNKAPSAVAVPSEDDWRRSQSATDLEKKFLPLMVGQMDKGLPRFLAGQGTRMLRCMMTACRVNPKLLQCTPLSLFAATIQAGQLGLEIGGATGFAYLVPYKNEATLQIGYKGFVQLGYRSGQIKRITPVEVRKGDYYAVKRGMHQQLDHTPERNNKGIVTDYYVVIELVNGGLDFEEFTVEEAIAFRDRYSAGRAYKSGPWYEPFSKDGDPSPEFNAMALKTLIRKLFKRLPVSAEAQLAAGLDELSEMGLPQNLGHAMLPSYSEPESATEQLENRLEGKSPPPAPPAEEKEEPKADARLPSHIARLLDQIKELDPEADYEHEWLKSTGFDSLEHIDMLSPKKKTALKEQLRAKVVELGGDPVPG
jgi:recombination protein RecT